MAHLRATRQVEGRRAAARQALAELDAPPITADHLTKLYRPNARSYEENAMERIIDSEARRPIKIPPLQHSGVQAVFEAQRKANEAAKSALFNWRTGVGLVEGALKIEPRVKKRIDASLPVWLWRQDELDEVSDLYKQYNKHKDEDAP